MSQTAGGVEPAAEPPRGSGHGGGLSRQLEVEPLPYDGVASVAIGTGLWLVALLAMIPFIDDLEADGMLWWVATAAVGFVLGLVGLWIVVRRRNRLRASA